MNALGVTKISEKQLEIRRKKFEILCRKFEIRGKLNKAECYFSEVSYKHFAKSHQEKEFREFIKKHRIKLNKTVNSLASSSSCKTMHSNRSFAKKDSNKTFAQSVKSVVSENKLENKSCNDNDSGADTTGPKNKYCDGSEYGVDISCKDFNNDDNLSQTLVNSSTYLGHEDIDILDDGNDKTVIEMSQTNNNCVLPEKLGQLIDLIEGNLQSELKFILNYKSISELLETGESKYWHKRAIKEMKRLEKHISRDELKEYMRHCYFQFPKCFSINVLRDTIVRKLKSNVEKLFLKREFFRSDTIKYTKYNKMIHLEWKRLSEVIPEDYLIYYGFNLLSSVQKLKQNQIKEKSL